MTQTIDNLFAELYCKDREIEFNSCSSEYVENGFGYKSILVRGSKKNGELFCEEVGVLDAFNLLSKYILNK